MKSSMLDGERPRVPSSEMVCKFWFEAVDVVGIKITYDSED